jgi:hypothetical protein
MMLRKSLAGCSSLNTMVLLSGVVMPEIVWDAMKALIEATSALTAPNALQYDVKPTMVAS